MGFERVGVRIWPLSLNAFLKTFIGITLVTLLLYAFTYLHRYFSPVLFFYLSLLYHMFSRLRPVNR